MNVRLRDSIPDPSLDAIRLDDCPVCKARSTPWRTKHTPAGAFPIEVCSACDYAFVNPRPSLAFLMDFYNTSGHSHTPCATPIETAVDAVSSEARFPNSSLDARRIVGTMARLLHGATRGRFLDVGCGYGFYVRQARQLGFDVEAIELASTERRIAKELADVDAQAISFEQFEAPAGSFSAILMSQILEHAHDVNLWMEKSHRLLSQRGVLAVAVPNFASAFRRVLQEKEPFITPPSHLNFFTPTSLARLLASHGFRVAETQWVSRLSPSAFAKRLPSGTRFLAPLLQKSSSLALAAIDRLHLGQLITVYGIKE